MDTIDIIAVTFGTLYVITKVFILIRDKTVDTE